MPYINKSRRVGTLDQVISRHEDGSILQGEADMYKRIQADCERRNSAEGGARCGRYRKGHQEA